MPVLRHLTKDLKKEYDGKGKEAYSAFQKIGRTETKLRSVTKAWEFPKKNK